MGNLRIQRWREGKGGRRPIQACEEIRPGVNRGRPGGIPSADPFSACKLETGKSNPTS